MSEADCSPRHATHFDTSSLKCNGTLGSWRAISGRPYRGGEAGDAALHLRSELLVRGGGLRGMRVVLAGSLLPDGLIDSIQPRLFLHHHLGQSQGRRQIAKDSYTFCQVNVSPLPRGQGRDSGASIKCPRKDHSMTLSSGHFDDCSWLHRDEACIGHCGGERTY
jgi:hypothetical protein